MAGEALSEPRMALVVGAMKGPGARGLFVMVAGNVFWALGVGAGVPVGGRQGSI